MDDDLDLTDLGECSDEYGYEEISATKKKGKGKAQVKSAEFTLCGVLKPPRSTTYSTEALYKQIHKGDIDLDPEYQRDVVWPESKQIGIIESMLLNYPIPQVIFAVNMNDDGTETRTCIDGKQRLTSIYRYLFLRSCLDIHSKTRVKWWYCDNSSHPAGKSKNILPEKFRAQFARKQLQCIEHQDVTNAVERDIFQRVQRGVALTPAEKLKAIATPRAQFVRKLIAEHLDNDASSLSSTSLPFDRARGSDFRCLTQATQCIATNKVSSVPAMEKWLADITPLAPAFVADIESTYRVFGTLVRDQQHTAVFVKITPIEFITVGILVHHYKAHLSLGALGKAVQAMRVDVRAQHDEIRNNLKVYKTMKVFIDAYEGPPLARGEVCAEDAVREGDPVRAGTKRKALHAPDQDDGAAGDSDADDDNAHTRPTAPRKRTKPSTVPVAVVPPPASTSRASAPRKRPSPTKSTKKTVTVPVLSPASTSTVTEPREGSVRAPAAEERKNIGCEALFFGRAGAPLQLGKARQGIRPAVNGTPQNATHHPQETPRQPQNHRTQQQHDAAGVAALDPRLVCAKDRRPGLACVKTESGASVRTSAPSLAAGSTVSASCNGWRDLTPVSGKSEGVYHQQQQNHLQPQPNHHHQSNQQQQKQTGAGSIAAEMEANLMGGRRVNICASER
ncbi:hypothetical protein B0H19DRAFT_1258000 [Mycena capillaripes]|nr:hypothetical protein B0H19DRAFT_1258000 [Mycena capillaripes]